MDWKDEQEAMRRQDEERSIERWRRYGADLDRVTPRDGRKVQPPDRSKFWGGDVHPLQKGVPW